MQLKALLDGIAKVRQDVAVSGVTLDSRRVAAGDLFIALAGSRQHGLRHVEEALAKGASAVIYEPAGAETEQLDQLMSVTSVEVPQLAQKLGVLASRFYGEPSQKMNVIGITGTNGKTSCSLFLGQLLDDCAIVGTMGWGRWGALRETLNTTPDAVAVQTMLAEFVANGNQTVVMEVSSHGLEQGRVGGVHFTGAVFTNLSRDHLDYHGSMEDYLNAKLALFKTPGLAFAVVNLDDPHSERIIAATPEQVALWGVTLTGAVVPRGVTLAASNIRQEPDGSRFEVNCNGKTLNVRTALYGDFNVMNAVTVLAVLLAGGMPFAAAADKLATLQPVPGRMERFGGFNAPLIFVDYAHTPDALDQVLSGLRRHCREKLWVVFGCGGNRDAGKRPQMGQIAERWADHVVLTDDNPRDEASAAIIASIKSGCRTNKITVIPDRATAIKTTIAAAAAGDCLVIAGKGHENYQEIRGVKRSFSDQRVVRDALATVGQSHEIK